GEGEAVASAGRIAVMRAGRVEQIGEPREIYDAPATSFVASFVGATNLLNGTVAHRERAVFDVAIGGATLRVRPDVGEPGENVDISLRPEGFRVLRQGEPPPQGW